MITITRSHYLISRGARRPMCWLYEATSEDGHRFTNTSLAEIRAVIRRKLGRDIVIVESWKIRTL